MHTCSPQAPSGPRPAATPRFTPHLELFAAPVLFADAEGLGTRDERRKAPLIAVSFDYDGRRVRASDPDDASPVARDPVGEARACRELERHGAIELACLENVVPLTERAADYLVRLEGSASDLCRFSTEALPRLQALGWQVAVADDYPYQVVAEAPQLFAEVIPESERPGWFALELGIEVDGRRIDLLPMLIELLEDAEEDTQLKALAARHATPHAVGVSDSRYVLVAGEQLAALLRVLVELYQGVPRRGRSLSFPAVRAAALGSLERALAG
ncbi:MAG: hypothetical protein IT373_38490, partial [Polyangiaceae bacterium]|nr:hypothetical protein [Polyangiaceae bacterium]